MKHINKFKDSPPRRAFVITREAWYGNAVLPDGAQEVMIGDYPDEGGTSGEFAIRWEELCGVMTPFLVSYHDSWAMLAYCHDLVEALEPFDGKEMTPQDLVTVLKDLGFADVTQREKP